MREVKPPPVSGPARPGPKAALSSAETARRTGGAACTPCATTNTSA